MNEIQTSREYKIVKKNELIQTVAKRKYELTALEQKVLGYILSLIKPAQDITCQPIYVYEFSIRDFCRVCGINYDSGTNYENVKKALKRLADNSFWLDSEDDELYFQWITTPRIRKKTGKVVIKISDDVMPYLYNLQEKFTTYELYQILALKSGHSIALYELLKSYAFKKNVTLTIENIKRCLSIEGKYKEYKAFRRKIIEPALEEINEFTDLDVTWRPIREGRFYTSIEFTILSKKNWESYASYRRTMDALDHKMGE